ncbi:hypothetical protein ACHAWF_013854 [Thalassiosira exigua]
MESICHRAIDEWIERTLKPAIESESTFDPCHEMLSVAFRVVCETVFEYDATREECDLFLSHGEVTAIEFGFKQMMNPLRPILGKWLAERAEAYKSVEWRFKTNDEKLPEIMLWLFAGHDTVGGPERDKREQKSANISMQKLGVDHTTPDGYFIPKGTRAFLPQHLPNHDKHIYSNPELFLTSRWDNPLKDMLDAHMMFAAGPRSCPGLSLAQAELNVIIPKLVSRYDFELVDKGETKFFITLKPVGARLLPKYAEK